MTETFRQRIEEIIKVKHDEMSDDECIGAICAEVERLAEGMPKKDDVFIATYSDSDEDGATYSGIEQGINACQEYIKKVITYLTQ